MEAVPNGSHPTHHDETVMDGAPGFEVQREAGPDRNPGQDGRNTEILSFAQNDDRYWRYSQRRPD